MSEPAENNQSTEQMSKLSQAIRDVKNDSADRDDVVVEMREASRMRLELLAQELTGVFEEAGKDDPQFDFAISSGLQPRLWIDATAHVAMGRDRRVYRFVRDTRLGRVVLAETADMKPVAEQVTRYVAERVLERKRMMEGDVEPVLPQMAAAAEPEQRQGPVGGFFGGLTLVLLGALAGAAGVLGWLWDKLPPAAMP